MPDFQAPPTWPNIINTAVDLDEEEDFDGTRDTDADSQHPGMFDEDDTGQDGDDGDDPQEAGSEVEVPLIEQPENENLAGFSRGGSIDLTMEWDEGDDEGMGMEEPDYYDEPPNRSAKRLGTGPKKSNGKLVEKCPVCSQSMKGKKDNVSHALRLAQGTDSQVIEKHINTCLDSSARKANKPRPISSMAHTFSPAPSSPSPPPETPVKGPNAFSVLMSGHKEKEQWKTAEDDLRRDGKRTYGRRPAPFYKVSHRNLTVHNS
jgi:DNA cross-link repair 1A protein